MSDLVGIGEIKEEDKQVVKDFEAKLKTLTDECGIEIKSAIVFPRYNQMPADVLKETNFALYLLNKHGGVITASYKRKEQVA